MVRVLIVDDQDEARLGIRWSLSKDPGIEVVGEAEDGVEAIRLAEQLVPDVVIMDVRMPILNGLDAASRILRTPDAPNVLLVTTFDSDEYAFRGLEIGVSGFIVKGMASVDLAAAVWAVARGDAVLTPRITGEVLKRAGWPRVSSGDAARLTPRERDFVALAGAGLSNTEIAERLCLSSNGVRVSLSRLLNKLGLRDRAQLIVFAFQNHLEDRAGTDRVWPRGSRQM